MKILDKVKAAYYISMDAGPLDALNASLRRANRGGFLDLPKPFKVEPVLGAETKSFASGRGFSICLVVHVHYMEFALKLSENSHMISNFYDALFVTTSSSEIAGFLEAQTWPNNTRLKIRQVPNRGRNFGPMLVEFAREIPHYDFVAHLHSKRSLHTAPEDAQAWGKSYWTAYLSIGQMCEIVSVMIASSASLSYFDAPSWMPTHNFFWNANRIPARRLGLPVSYLKRGRRLVFPVGGMFVARTQALQRLWSKTWGYEDFPIEIGQLDGTLQHAIERMIGAIAFDFGPHLCLSTRATMVLIDLD